MATLIDSAATAGAQSAASTGPLSPPPPAAVPVAIVGMAALLPGAPDLDTYWRNILGGVDAITDVPANRWDAEFYDPSSSADRADRVYCRRGGFVDEFASVDPLRFGIMPDSIPGAEPDQLIALRVAAEAIEDAGGRDALPDADRVGVVLGRGGYLTPGLVRLDQRVRTANQLLRTLRELIPELPADRVEQVRCAFTEALGPNRPEAAIGLVPNLAASRIANRLDVRGPAYTVDAACASSLVAVDQAVAELASGRCDMMLAGGVHHCHDITLWSVFSQLGALSRNESIRPFHRAADGVLIGEGTGVVVLKRLDDAVADGDRIYAVIRGTGVASDGRAASLFNPEPAGQVRAVRRAWEAAGLDPRAADALGLLEAHGTATPAGDTAELATLAEVFGPRQGEDAAVPLGSVKSMIGHTMPAAGIASLIKAALAIHHSVLPPTLHCDDPHPDLKATRFEPLAEARPWTTSGSAPRRAGVNAFGFGGINAHVVLEQAPGSSVDPEAGGERIIRLAAASPAELLGLLDRGETQSPDPTAPCRIAIADPTPKKLTLARRILTNGKAWRGRSDIWFSPNPLLTDTNIQRRIAFVFPGLEAEFTPRVDDVAAKHGVTLNSHDASTGVGAHGVGVVEVGRLLARALNEMGVQPGAVAGHSVGEWTAMINAGLYSGPAVDRFLDEFDPDSLRVPGLVFGAIGAGVDRVLPLLGQEPFAGVELSHDNAPNQCIVCGPEDEIDGLMRHLRKRNILCQALPFRSGFHTPMLEPYLGPITEAADRFELHAPSVPVWSATIAAPFPQDAAQVRDLFVRHLVEPVRFRQMIENMYENGFRVFVQTGTGALATVIGDVLSGREHLAIAANSPQRSGLEQLARVAAALWVEGLESPSDQTTRQPARRSGLPMELDLGGALITLGDRAPKLALGAPGASALDTLAATQQPVAAELAALLRETAESATAVLAARGDQSGQGDRSRPRTNGPVRLRVDIDSMPYLIDHCFFAQRADWPDISDLFPVVPATTVIQHMMDAAESPLPGQRAVAVLGARFDRWTAVIPSHTVEISTTPDAGVPGRVKVGFGGYARSTVELAAAYPAPPAAWPVDSASERPAHITADQLYADRWMFHGPRFRALTELTALGDQHVRGVITAPEAPGALLDNVGQLLGYWIMSTHEHRTVVFPVGMRRITFYGPPPTPGTKLTCHIRIRTIDEVQLIADAQLAIDGTVWADFEGWTDRRFGSHPDTRAVERSPGTATLAHRQPGGWVAVFDRWSDPASRDLRMRSYLGGDERQAYEAQSPRVRGQWLLGRVAAKDAVRRALWDDGAVEGPFYPAQIRVRNEPTGRPYLEGMHGTELAPYDVSIAHSGEVGVALIGPGRTSGGTGVGIDVEQVLSREQSAFDFAFTAGERELLRTLGGDGPLWFARFWVAKEAAAKAEGTGLRGNPKAFAVVHAALAEDADAAELTVRTSSTRHHVRTVALANPEDLPERHYQVGWTVDGAAVDAATDTEPEETHRT
ncbi:MAG TPA: beta-ketoacyl synthase N-terminal-like domain-containing protein [Actinospica sp.]|nr:beta-ketoacyl synthase N-terminal-like domain-containing protein [Actinospica sp.]